MGLNALMKFFNLDMDQEYDYEEDFDSIPSENDYEPTERSKRNRSSRAAEMEEEPKKQTDCTNYGTDSGMYCCWVAKDENDSNGKCHLISLTKIERSGIDGCAQFSDSYWSCGNYSNNIKMNRIIWSTYDFYISN